MANRLKMAQQEVMFSLFEQGWSNRKINKALEIDRRAISRYRSLWTEAKAPIAPPDPAAEGFDSSQPAIQNVPPKCPPEGVVHFQVPFDIKQKIPIRHQVPGFKIMILIQVMRRWKNVGRGGIGSVSKTEENEKGHAALWIVERSGSIASQTPQVAQSTIPIFFNFACFAESDWLLYRQVRSGEGA